METEQPEQAGGMADAYAEACEARRRELRELVPQHAEAVIEFVEREAARLEGDLISALGEAIEIAKRGQAGEVARRAALPPAQVHMETELAAGLRIYLQPFARRDFDNPDTMIELRKAIGRYLAVRFPRAPAPLLAALVMRHTHAEAGFRFKAADVVAELWAAGYR